jgi:hypothetical protein
MANGKVDLASGLGSTVRMLGIVLTNLIVLVGIGLIIYGVWQFDDRIACIVAGFFILTLMWPRPVRRK